MVGTFIILGSFQKKIRGDVLYIQNEVVPVYRAKIIIYHISYVINWAEVSFKTQQIPDQAIGMTDF